MTGPGAKGGTPAAGGAPGRSPAGLRDDVWAAFRARNAAVQPGTNFFEAGLSSALLVEVLADLHAAGLELSLVDLYRYPTVTELAAALAGRRAPGPAPGAALPWARRDGGSAVGSR